MQEKKKSVKLGLKECDNFGERKGYTLDAKRERKDWGKKISVQIAPKKKNRRGGKRRYDPNE